MGSNGITLDSASESQHAVWLRRQGKHIIMHNSRYWCSGPPGFYNAIHWLARMSAVEASRPAPLCWGYRTTLREEDASTANGALPVHVRSDIQGYDLGHLTSRNRNKVRKCLAQTRFIELQDPTLICEQGYRVAQSAYLRNGYGNPGSHEQYKSRMNNYFKPRHGMVMAALLGDHLAGYITGYAIDHTAYIESVCLETESLNANIGIGLFHEWMLACARSGLVNELVHSPHLREHAGLSRHKKGLGFDVIHVPARVWFVPPVERIVIHKLVRAKRPNAYYRLYGVE